MCRTLLPALVCVMAALPALGMHPWEDPPITAFMSGLQEVSNEGIPGVGDPDATGAAWLQEDHGNLLWRLDYQNVSGEQISGLHIHGPGATPTTNRPIFIDLLETGLLAPMPLPDGEGQGYLVAQDAVMAAKIQQVFDNPREFYINLHTTGAGGFPAGAIRGNLPEPTAAAALIVLAAAALVRRPGHLCRSRAA